MARTPTRTDQAVDAALAALTLVTGFGLALIVVGLLTDTRASVPALGLVVVIVGGSLAWQFGVRPIRRRKRSVLPSTGNGFRLLGSWARRLVSPRR